jgi:uncharacterized protein YndB with AHSA1/START domain
MTDTRAFEMTIEIAVSPDAVWQALTDPTEVTRWFASHADIQPGIGGKWMVSWDGNWPWNTEIEIWEPSRHLRLVDRAGRPYDAEGKAVLTSVAAMPIAIDWYLEGQSGSTTLRLVHSGFGRGGAWDDEYEGVSLGWLLELNGLRHYLERHRGEARQVAWSRTVVAAPVDSLWSRFTGPDGLVRDSSMLHLRAGERYSTTLSTGDRIEGTVIANVPGRGVQVTVDGWNDALYRLWIDRVGEDAAVNSWLTTYGMPDTFASEFNDRMRAEVNRVAAAQAVVY